jgi:L-fuculose-phosphate aldolase
MPKAWQEISRFGRKTVVSGLTSSRFGNISLCRGEKIFITRTGSMLDELDQTQVVEVDLRGPCDRDKEASSETSVHRAIYLSTNAKAIIHTHSPFAVALSLLECDVVVPLDREGLFFLGAMPIVEGLFGTDELAKALCSGLQSHKACIARGHGVFAPGITLSEAYALACMAEHSAQVRYLVKNYSGKESNQNARV